MTDLKTERACLETGDYGIKIEGVLAPVVLERKGLGDCFSSFTGDNYRREKEKIERAKALGWRYVLGIEATASRIRLGTKYCQKDGLSMLRQLERISEKYKIEIRYAYDAKDLAFMTQELLLTYVRHYDSR